eukprot:COSAG02_NODE_68283_length_251_cov_0.592105_1_plen_63_part_10
MVSSHSLATTDVTCKSEVQLYLQFLSSRYQEMQLTLQNVRAGAMPLLNSCIVFGILHVSGTNL